MSQLSRVRHVRQCMSSWHRWHSRCTARLTMPCITTARADDQQLNGRSTRQSTAGDVRGAIHEDGLSRPSPRGQGYDHQKSVANFLYLSTLGYSKLDIFSAFHPHVYLIWLIYSTSPSHPSSARPRGAHMADGFPAGAPQHCPMTPQLAGAPAPHLGWRMCREEPPPSTCD